MLYEVITMQYKKGDRVYIGISQSLGEDSTGYISIYDVDNATGIIMLAVLMVRNNFV